MHIAHRSLIENFSAQILAENPKQFAVIQIICFQNLWICQRSFRRLDMSLRRLDVCPNILKYQNVQTCISKRHGSNIQKKPIMHEPLSERRSSVVLAETDPPDQDQTVSCNCSGVEHPCQGHSTKEKKTGKYGKFSQNVSRHASQE